MTDKKWQGLTDKNHHWLREQVGAGGEWQGLTQTGQNKKHHWLREQVGVAQTLRDRVARHDRQKPPLVKRAGGSGRVVKRQTKTTTG